MRNRNFLILWCALFFPILSTGQDTKMQLQEAVKSLKGLKDVSYYYVRTIEYPNGDKDTVKGTLYLDNTRYVLLDDCDAYTMIRTRKWAYSANHRLKSLDIIDLDKSPDRQLKRETERKIFLCGAMNEFIDSIIMKKATVAHYKEDASIIAVELSFPSNGIASSASLVLDKKSKLPLSYEITMFQPWQSSPKGMQSVEVRMICSRYRRINTNDKFDERKYFIIKGNKLELKKYNNYKLSAKI